MPPLRYRRKAGRLPQVKALRARTAHRQIYLPLLYVTHLLLCFMIALNSNDVELASHQPLFK